VSRTPGLRIARTRPELARARAQLGPTVGLVPTMGALHAGHLALIEQARAECDSVVVSIFVNPMQFNQAADLDRYPRPESADLAACERAGVDLAYLPDVRTVYPDGPAQVWVTAGALADQLEGPDRPGHFDGVLTMVTKLFTSIAPGRAYFGEKDYQQLTLVRRLVRELDLPVTVVGVPTVREPDGLALSSRNVFLSAAQRGAALSLIRALRAGCAAAATPGDPAAAVLAAASAELARAGADPAGTETAESAGADRVRVDYLELRDPDLGPAPASGPARLLVAATVGGVRLIDNVAVELAR
jgi:pantoate--beta-alanine ligase